MSIEALLFNGTANCVFCYLYPKDSIYIPGKSEGC